MALLTGNQKQPLFFIRIGAKDSCDQRVRLNDRAPICLSIALGASSSMRVHRLSSLNVRRYGLRTKSWAGISATTHRLVARHRSGAGRV
jgi:hypothetical protein